MLNLESVKNVIINGRSYDIDGNATSIDEIKAVAAEIDPSLANADPVLQGETIVFTKRAGTKGAEAIKKVVVSGRTLEVDEDMYDNPIEIKRALEEVYPELTNSDYVISGDTMTFVQRAGTKGL